MGRFEDLNQKGREPHTVVWKGRQKATLELNPPASDQAMESMVENCCLLLISVPRRHRHNCVFCLAARRRERKGRNRTVSSISSSFGPERRLQICITDVKTGMGREEISTLQDAEAGCSNAPTTESLPAMMQESCLQWHQSPQKSTALSPLL